MDHNVQLIFQTSFLDDVVAKIQGHVLGVHVTMDVPLLKNETKKKQGMVKNPFWQELTSWLNVQLWPLSSTHDSHETTSGQSSALTVQELT